MRSTRPNPFRTPRRGIAALEMAVLLPGLLFLFLIAVDFGRVFYYSTIVANCARNAALWECDPYRQSESPYQDLREAALADASNFDVTDNTFTVTSKTGTDADNNGYVEATVTYQFNVIASFPGIPSSVDVSRTVRMSVSPKNPEPESIW